MFVYATAYCVIFGYISKVDVPSDGLRVSSHVDV